MSDAILASQDTFAEGVIDEINVAGERRRRALGPVLPHRVCLQAARVGRVQADTMRVQLRAMTANDSTSDIAPTSAMLAAHKSACNDFAKSVAEWRALNGADLSALNAALTAAGKTPLTKAAGGQAPACGP